MLRRSVFASFALASLSISGLGCVSHKRDAVATVNQPTILPALVTSPDLADFSPQEYRVDAGEMRWLTSRNDSQRIEMTGTPEVADPGAYSIVTRDFQRTNNGRPWNHWSSETRVFQRGAGR